MKTPAGAGAMLRRIMCEHVFDTTTRYDTERKLLTFLLCCPVCETERVVETLRYEPSFKPLQTRRAR